jgi:glycerophosphoryl diester phosphodiesterase
VDAIGPAKELVTAQVMDQATRSGLSVHPWTADEEPEIRRLLSLGVASVTTNAPEIALRIRDGAPSEERGIAVSRPA